MARYDVTLPDNPPGCLTPNSLEKASRQFKSSACHLRGRKKCDVFATQAVIQEEGAKLCLVLSYDAVY